MDGNRGCRSGGFGSQAAQTILEVLGQLPPDVVDSQVWQQLDPQSRSSFAQSSPACARLFRATRQSLQLRGSLLEPQAAAVLELYVACTRLRVHLRPTAAEPPAPDALSVLAGRLRAWDRTLAVLLRLTPGTRARYRTIGVYGLEGALGIAFTANLAACFPHLRELELGEMEDDDNDEGCALDGLPAGVSALLPLVALQHLRSLKVVLHGHVSVEELDADLDDLGRLTQLSQLVVEAGIAAEPLVRPNLTPLSALRNLADLSVHLCFYDGVLFEPVVDALPPSLQRLTLGGGRDWLDTSLDAAACDAIGRLTRLEELVVGKLQPRPGATSGRLPPTVRWVKLWGASTSDLPALVPALGLLGTGATVDFVALPAGGPDAPTQLRLLHGPAARLGGLRLCLGQEYDEEQGPFDLTEAADAELHLLGPALCRLELHTKAAGSVTPRDVQAAERLGQQLAACTGLEELKVCIPGGTQAVMGPLVRRVLAAGPTRLRQFTIEAKRGLAAEAGSAVWLGICLGLRAAAGLPPLRIETDLVSAAEARLLLSELCAAGHAGYAMSSTRGAA